MHAKRITATSSCHCQSCKRDKHKDDERELAFG